MDDMNTSASGCDSHQCGNNGQGHMTTCCQHSCNDDHEWTNDELMAKKEKLEKRLAWVNEKLDAKK